MFIIVEFVSNDRFNHIVDTNKFEPMLKADIERKVKADPYVNFDSKYFMELIQGVVIGHGIFPLAIEGKTSVYMD